MITEVTLPPELIEAAASLEQRLRILDVPTRKIPLSEWAAVPQNVHDLIPSWIPTLLAHFSLFGAWLEYLHEKEDEPCSLFFCFWGPDRYALNLSGKSRYCFTDEFIAEGLVMISDECSGNMWLTSISDGPSSPIYFFDLSGHEKHLISNGIARLMCSMAVSKIQPQ